MAFVRRYFAAKFVHTPEEAIKGISNLSSVAIGGFAFAGVPENLISAVSRTNIKDLTVVSCDSTSKGYGVDLLLKHRQIKRLVTAFVGGSTNVESQYFDGELELDLTPMGTLAEKLRAGGAGIPAFYTPTGFGTIVSDGGFAMKKDKIFSEAKPTIFLEGRNYVLEKTIRTDFALVKAWKADKLGNLIYRGSSQNFNPLCAMAGKHTIVEVEEIVEELDPNHIQTPGVYVNTILQGPSYVKPIEKLTVQENQHSIPSNRLSIIKRAACELRDGMSVNLGIGMPTLIANCVPKDMNIYLQSENGILGLGPYPFAGQEHPDFINAGKETVTLMPGAALFHSAESFAMIRGGHVQLTFLGALEVSQDGDLANWIVPGKMVKGMGGAMDLVAAPSKKIITMLHTHKGEIKIVKNCSLPLTGKQVVDLLITELAVFDFKRESGMTLIEVAEGATVDDVRNNTGCEFMVASDLKKMKN